MRRGDIGLIAAVSVATGLAACSGEEQKRDASPPVSQAASSLPNPVPGVQTSAPPLGGGSSLTGATSGLKGDITGFTFRQTATQTIVELASDVLFAFDSANLTTPAELALQRTAQLVSEGGAGTVQVIGHTDGLGADAYNQALSRRRAEAVSRWLSASGGVPAARLHAEGRGKAEPVVPNTTPDGQDDPAGRAKNRRVVVIIPR